MTKSIQQIFSFGTTEGIARGLNWGTMALLPLLLHSSEEYGRIGLIVAIETLIGSILLVGTNRAILRFYATEESPGRLISSILAIWGGLSWLPFVGIFVLHLAGWETLFDIPLFPHLLILSIIVALFNLNLYCVNIGQAQRNLTIFLRFRLCYTALKFIFVLLMAGLLRNSLGYVLGIGIAGTVMLVFILPFMKNRTTAPPDLNAIKRLLIFGWPFVFHVLSGNILVYFSRFFLQAYNTTKDVGIFTFAFTLGSSLYIVYAILATYFEPRIYSHSNDKANSEKWLGFFTNTCVAVAAAGGLTMLLLYPYLLSFLWDEYAQEKPIIAVIIGTVLIQPLYLEGNYRLTVYQKTHQIAISSFLGAGLNILFCILLIPSQGIFGAAVALYISSCALSAYILITSMRAGQISWRQQRRLITYGTCTIGSLSTVIMNEGAFVTLALLGVCLVTLGLLAKSFTNRA